MGLMKAGIGALQGVMADQWREYFYCDSLNADTLVTKGEKRQSKRGSNTKGDVNIISDGSIIAMNEGQCMLIVEQGKVAEVCAEAGEFVYDTSTEPSVFYGPFGEKLRQTFDTIGKRFTFGGETAKDQRVYYVNTKEILGNKFGTASPVPFRVVDTNIGLDMDIEIRCHGEYSYKIVDPILFYTNVCGNVTEEYKREGMDSQLKAELLTALQPAFAQISEQGIRYSALPGHTMEIAAALNDVLSEKWTSLRGLALTSFAVGSVTASEEDEKTIKELQKTAVLRNTSMAAAMLTGAQAEAMKAAASNTATGPMLAFAGMNMANQAGGINANQLFAMGGQGAEPVQQQQKESTAQENAGWICECGTKNTGKFCSECGRKSPEKEEWKCSCGTLNTGKFCSECGKARC